MNKEYSCCGHSFCLSQFKRQHTFNIFIFSISLENIYTSGSNPYNDVYHQTKFRIYLNCNIQEWGMRQQNSTAIIEEGCAPSIEEACEQVEKILLDKMRESLWFFKMLKLDVFR